MRIVYAALCAVMLGFAAVQYNDPDGPAWVAVYGLPAVWAGIAALRPRWLLGRTSAALLAISLAALVALTIVLWPPVPGWWHEEVWTMGDAVDGPVIAEQAREGMGLMIATAVLVLVTLASLVSNRRASGASPA